MTLSIVGIVCLVVIGVVVVVALACMFILSGNISEADRKYKTGIATISPFMTERKLIETIKRAGIRNFSIAVSFLEPGTVHITFYRVHPNNFILKGKIEKVKETIRNHSLCSIYFDYKITSKKEESHE